MIRGIIFDCFGVLTTDGWLRFRSQHFQKGSEAYREVIELNHQADIGSISHDEFIQGIGDLIGMEAREIEATISGHTANNELFDYIRDELKSHYKIGLLSNASDDRTADLFSPDQVALFDEKVFSFRIGVDKPHAAMYETIATRLGLLTEECIFIDDREEFIAGARDAGMHGVVFESNVATKHAIAETIRRNI